MVDAGTYVEIFVSGGALPALVGAELRCRVDDRDVVGKRWRSERLPVLPGQHRVEVWFQRRSGERRFGPAQTELDVPAGRLARLMYRAPVFLVGDGRLEAAGITPATVDLRPPAGWYPDPTGRRDKRWWDGADWTSHVQQGGVTIEDPL